MQRTHNPPPKGHRRFDSDPAHQGFQRLFISKFAPQITFRSAIHLYRVGPILSPRRLRT
jgi:hypothetical protein